MAVPAPTGSDDSWFRLGLTFMLVLANGFFVCAEFAFVGARRSRLQQLGDAGDRKARRALSVLDDLDRMIAGTQVGITLASLALGWIGEPALADLIDGGLRRLGVSAPSAVVHSTSAVVTAFVIIT